MRMIGNVLGVNSSKENENIEISPKFSPIGKEHPVSQPGMNESVKIENEPSEDSEEQEEINFDQLLGDAA